MRSNEWFRFKCHREYVEILAEFTWTEGEEVLDRGNTLSEFTRPISEIVRIKDKCFGPTVRQHISLIIDRTHRVQRRRTRGVDLVRRHVEEHFRSV